MTPPLRTGAYLVAAGAWLLTACDVPTSPPEWETTWVVPGDSLVMEVSSLLPSSVVVSRDGSAFLLSLDAIDFGRTLGQVCPSCQTFDGFVVPKPAFASTFTDVITLPTDVVAASLTGGQVDVRLTNGFNFDPIRPGAGAQGVIRVRVLYDGVVLAADSLHGSVDSFPAGSQRVLTLDLGPAEIRGAVDVEVSIDSPSGDPVAIDASLPFSVGADPGQLSVADAEVAVTDKAVDIEQADLDLADVEDDMIRRIRGGALRLAIRNPFSIEGGVDLSLTAPGTSITKTIALEQGETVQRVEFTGAELRSIVGENAAFGATGVVSAPTGTITITPSQVLTLDADLELVLGPEEG